LLIIALPPFAAQKAAPGVSLGIERAVEDIEEERKKKRRKRKGRDGATSLAMMTTAISTEGGTIATVRNKENIEICTMIEIGIGTEIEEMVDVTAIAAAVVTVIAAAVVTVTATTADTDLHLAERKKKTEAQDSGLFQKNIAMMDMKSLPKGIERMLFLLLLLEEDTEVMNIVVVVVDRDSLPLVKGNTHHNKCNTMLVQLMAGVITTTMKLLLSTMINIEIEVVVGLGITTIVMVIVMVMVRMVVEKEEELLLLLLHRHLFLLMWTEDQLPHRPPLPQYSNC